MTPREAVVAAFADNSEWMSTRTGIVQFILGECELGQSNNAEYDEVILQNASESRSAAAELDSDAAFSVSELAL